MTGRLTARNREFETQGAIEMGKTVRDVMTPNPVAMEGTSTLLDAAKAMRDSDIGAVVVLDHDRKVVGLATDRGLVLRGVTQGLHPANARLEEVASKNITTLGPNDSLSDATHLMRSKAIRRIPVVDQGKPVGMLSISDLALERDPNSVLGDISSAPPNR